MNFRPESSPTAEWLRHSEATRRITRRKHPDASGTLLFDRAVEENVLVQIKHLETHPAVAELLADNNLRIHGLDLPHGGWRDSFVRSGAPRVRPACHDVSV